MYIYRWVRIRCITLYKLAIFVLWQELPLLNRCAQHFKRSTGVGRTVAMALRDTMVVDTDFDYSYSRLHLSQCKTTSRTYEASLSAQHNTMENIMPRIRTIAMAMAMPATTIRRSAIQLKNFLSHGSALYSALQDSGTFTVLM